MEQISFGEIIEDINQVAMLLNQYNICDNIEPLQKEIGRPQNAEKENILWDYDIQGLQFELSDIFEHSRPLGLEDVMLVLSVTSESNEIGSDNMFKSLEIQIIIEGYFPNEQTGNVETSYASWHMDMQTDTGVPNFIHPLFHINFGGQKLENELVMETSPIILLRTPRLQHPPMDVFLAIDFVIQNFIGCRHQINDVPEYADIIEKYKKLHWKPYGEAFLSYLDDNKTTTEYGKKIMGEYS